VVMCRSVVGWFADLKSMATCGICNGW
jgi:hypothetical protein